MAQCLTPVIIKADTKGYHTKKYATDIFPCGRCPICIQRRVSGWTFRLNEEYKHSATATFLTLTYTDIKMEWTEGGYPTLNRKHFPAFIKRVRKQIEYYNNSEHDQPIKYYACGEYGTNTHRPHMHAIIFNLPSVYIDNPLLLEKIWGHGGLYFGTVTIQSIAYTAGYCLKKSSQLFDSIDDRVKEFSLMSKGMGLQYLTPNRVKFYKEHLEPYMVIEGGQKQSIPRYYKDKMYTDEERKVITDKSLAYLENLDVFKSAREENEWKKFQFFKADLKARQLRTKN